MSADREYSYTRTYRRRRRRARTIRLSVAAAATLAILAGYYTAGAHIVDRWFPSPTAAYWLACLAVVALTALVALALWARRA